MTAVRVPASYHQRGAFSIIAAVTLIMMLALLALVVDSGRLYLEKRRLQKIADVAALEAVARLPNGDCSAAPDDARVFATDNATRFSVNSSEASWTLTVDCVDIENIDGIRRGTASDDGRAVRVIARHSVPASLVLRAGGLFGNIPDQIALEATAIAERQVPTAAFSVGSQLLRLDGDGLLGAAGLGLTALGAEGLANATITPAGLLHELLRELDIDLNIHQLKALSPQGLVDLLADADVGLIGLDQLIDLSLSVVSESALRAELSALKNKVINSELRDVDLQLFGTAAMPGLIALTANPDDMLGSALDARVNLGDLIATGLLIGTGQRALEIPDLNVLGGANVQLGIVEPPSIGIGPVGTTAYNAQVRLYVGIDTDALLGGNLTWLTNLLNIRINLPLWIDLVSGHGTLEAIHCEAGETPSADIRAESDILNICVGHIPNELKWSTAKSCEYGLQNAELLRFPLRLLGEPLKTKSHIPALQYTELIEGIEVGETVSSSVNPLALGNTVDNLIIELLDLLSSPLRRPTGVLAGDVPYQPVDQNQLIANLARQYLEETKNSNGSYNVTAATNLILNGGNQYDDAGNQIPPPLVLEDWHLPKSIPSSCVLGLLLCQWKDGTFSQAFNAYAHPTGLLSSLGITPLANGYESCGGLLNVLLADRNNCIRRNLNKLLQEKPQGINLIQAQDGMSIANPATDQVSCSGLLCTMLKPVLDLLKPLLNGVGNLLTKVLDDVLGIELGRTDVHLHDLSCGAPALVR